MSLALLQAAARQSVSAIWTARSARRLYGRLSETHPKVQAHCRWSNLDGIGYQRLRYRPRIRRGSIYPPSSRLSMTMMPGASRKISRASSSSKNSSTRYLIRFPSGPRNTGHTQRRFAVTLIRLVRFFLVSATHLPFFLGSRTNIEENARYAGSH